MQKKRLFLFIIIIFSLVILYFWLKPKNNDIRPIQKEKKLVLKSHPQFQATPDSIKDEESIKQQQEKLLKLYCELKKLKLKIPLHETSLFSGYFGPTVDAEGNLGENILNAAIMDSDCPDNWYSVVSFRQVKGKWEEIQVEDCRSSTDTRIYLAYGLQKSITQEPGNFNLAINGDGFFLLQCEKHYLATRRGKFNLNTLSRLTNEDGCELLDWGLEPIKASPTDELSQEAPYCFKPSGYCLKLADRNSLKGHVSQLNSDYGLVIEKPEWNKMVAQFEKAAPAQSEIFSDTLEVLDEKENLITGLSQEAFEPIKGTINCP